MALSDCDNDRLELAKTAKASLEQARQLAKAGDAERALEHYLFAFDNSRLVSGWGGVRLSYIPSEIARLGRIYPPALAALTVRRDAREKMILQGETEYDLLSEWTALNKYLNDEDREFIVLKQVKKNGRDTSLLREQVIQNSHKRLLKEGKYELLSEYFDSFGHHFLHSINMYESEVLFPRQNEDFSISDFLRQKLCRDGADLFELALATRRTYQADEIVKRILMHCCTPDSFRLLIDAAGRAGKKAKIKELLKLAKTKLSQADYENLTASPDDVSKSDSFFQAIEKFFSDSIHKPKLDFELLVGSVIKAGDAEACIVFGHDGKVIAERGPKSMDSKLLAREALKAFMSSNLVAEKLKHPAVQLIIMQGSNGSSFVFDFDGFLLLILAGKNVELPM